MSISIRFMLHPFVLDMWKDLIQWHLKTHIGDGAPYFQEFV